MSHHARAFFRILGRSGVQRSLAARRFMLVLAMAASLLVPLRAFGLVNERMSFPHAATLAFNWFEPIEMRLSGLPVTARNFVTALPLEQAAKLMARHHQRFQRITTLPGAILLSGVEAGFHWVAQLEARQGLVQGMVSALPLDAASGSVVPDYGFLASWLAQNTRQVFSQASSTHGRAVWQSVHTPYRPFDVFVEALDRRLAASRWRRTGAHSWAAGADGVRHDGARIDVFPIPAPPGGAHAVLVSLSE